MIRILLAIAATLMLVGCSTSPTQRWAAARESLTTFQNVTLQLHSDGLVSDKDIVAMDPAVKAARKGLAVAESYLPDGGQDFDAWLDIVRQALGELRRSQMAEAREAVLQ
jgi:hypothetical protein